MAKISKERYQMLSAERDRLFKRVNEINTELKEEDDRLRLEKAKAKQARLCARGAHVVYTRGLNGYECISCKAPMVDDGY